MAEEEIREAQGQADDDGAIAKAGDGTGIPEAPLQETAQDTVGDKGKKHEKGSDEQFDRLGTASIGKLLTEFGIPAIMSMIISGTYQILTAMFLGWGVGDVGLAVSSIAAPMMIIFMAMAMLIGNGGNALAAIKLGEGKKDEAELVLGNSFTLAFIGWIVLAALAWFAIDPVLTLCGATEETWDLAKIFIRIVASGSVLQILGMGLNNYIRTAGDPNRALWTMLVGVLVDIVCSALFVLGFKWGVPGQGFATLIGQAVSTVLILYYFGFSKKAPFKLRVKNFRFGKGIPKQILAMGFAPFILQAAVAVVTVFVNHQVVVYGAMSSIGETGAYAMVTVIQRIAMFVMFPVTGIATAAQPILGYNYGAGKPERVKKTLTYELRFGVICCTCFWILIEIFSPTICTWFGVSEGVLEYTQNALRVQTILMPLMTFQIVISNYYQSTGRPMRSAIIALTRQIIILLPLYIIMPIIIGMYFPGIDQLMGIVIALPLSDLGAFIIGITCCIFEYRSLNRVIKAKQAGEEIEWGTHPGAKNKTIKA